MGRKKIYTAEYVEKELAWMLTELKKDESVIFLGQLFQDKRYSIQRYSEWKREFADNEEIQRLQAKLEEILETRAVVGAMRNDLNASFCQFHLKNNYGNKYKDRRDADVFVHVDMAQRMRLAEERRLRQLENKPPLAIEAQEDFEDV